MYHPHFGLLLLYIIFISTVVYSHGFSIVQCLHTWSMCHTPSLLIFRHGDWIRKWNQKHFTDDLSMWLNVFSTMLTKGHSRSHWHPKNVHNFNFEVPKIFLPTPYSYNHPSHSFCYRKFKISIHDFIVEW